MNDEDGMVREKYRCYSCGRPFKEQEGTCYECNGPIVPSSLIDEEVRIALASGQGPRTKPVWRGSDTRAWPIITAGRHGDNYVEVLMRSDVADVRLALKEGDVTELRKLLERLEGRSK